MELDILVRVCGGGAHAFSGSRYGLWPIRHYDTLGSRYRSNRYISSLAGVDSAYPDESHRLCGVVIRVASSALMAELGGARSLLPAISGNTYW